METKETVRIGAGAGTSDDRMVPALELAERGDIDYLVFECLAERTVSRENLARSKDPNLGYSPSLHARLRMVLPACMRNGIRIVSNMGAANPLGGARAARKEAADLGLGDVAVAVVLGDDVSSIVKHRARASPDRERRAAGIHFADDDFRQCLSRRRRGLRGAQYRRADRAVRPRCRSVAVSGADDARIRLGL